MNHKAEHGQGETPPLISLVLRAWQGPQRGSLLLALVCFHALCWLYLPNIVHLVWTWSTDENYGHGFLVPLLSLYFANEATRRGSPFPQQGGLIAGIVLIAMCISGRLLTTLVPIGMLADISFILGIAGIVGLGGGSGNLRRYRFAIGFLIFMVPLPVALYAMIASPLQRLVSVAASALLTLIGIPVLCQGNMLTLPGDVQLFVAEACSGMRQLTGFIALATAVAWLYPRPTWYRLILVFSSLPIAIGANIMRVSLTAWFAYAINPKLAGGWFHTVEGLLMLGIGMAMLALECMLLNRITNCSHLPHTVAARVLPDCSGAALG